MNEGIRVINRVPENTIIDAGNIARFFDGNLEGLYEGAEVFHNGGPLEPGKQYEIVRNENTNTGEVTLGIKIKVQLQPNDRISFG
jgi:hypothetical protein